MSNFIFIKQHKKFKIERYYLSFVEIVLNTDKDEK